MTLSQLELPLSNQSCLLPTNMYRLFILTIQIDQRLVSAASTVRHLPPHPPPHPRLHHQMRYLEPQSVSQIHRRRSRSATNLDQTMSLDQVSHSTYIARPTARKVGYDHSFVLWFAWTWFVCLFVLPFFLFLLLLYVMPDWLTRVWACCAVYIYLLCSNLEFV